MWSSEAEANASGRDHVALAIGARRATNDTSEYLGYASHAGLADDPRKNANLDFYRNSIPSVPDGDLIDVIHSEWVGNYEKLEKHHGYIQWLFPIPEMGINKLSQTLQRHEAEEIAHSEDLRARVERSLALMLDFYGMQIVDSEQGLVGRTEGFRERYQNLERYPHNWLRITRILKCIGMLGLARYQAPMCRFWLGEVPPAPGCTHSGQL